MHQSRTLSPDRSRTAAARTTRKAVRITVRARIIREAARIIVSPTIRTVHRADVRRMTEMSAVIEKTETIEMIEMKEAEIPVLADARVRTTRKADKTVREEDITITTKSALKILHLL